MKTIRAFVAVDVAEVQGAAARLMQRMSRADADVRWAASDQLHLTLKFLGDVSLQQVPEVCRAVESAAEGHGPFEIDLAGAGAFPHRQRPRTLWIGAARGIEPLRALQQAVDEALNELGFAPERRQYSPHVTIGRVRGGRNLTALSQRLESEAACEIGRAAVNELVVYSSTMGSAGPIYSPLGRVPL